MKIAIFAIIFCSFGCSDRVTAHPWGHEDEPDTEWIMNQYKDGNEVAVNNRRIVEGW